MQSNSCLGLGGIAVKCGFASGGVLGGLNVRRLNVGLANCGLLAFSGFSVVSPRYGPGGTSSCPVVGVCGLNVGLAFW